jgi:hypothetical protein
MDDGVGDDCIDDDVIDDGLDDGVMNEGLDDYGIDDDVGGEGELRYEMLWARDRRKVEYAGAKMMVSMMMLSMMMVSMMESRSS